VERLSQLVESPWPFLGAPAEMVAHRMNVINLAANIDTRIQKMYEVRMQGRRQAVQGGTGAGRAGTWWYGSNVFSGGGHRGVAGRPVLLTGCAPTACPTTPPHPPLPVPLYACSPCFDPPLPSRALAWPACRS
jgi:hypothetical protein